MRCTNANLLPLSPLRGAFTLIEMSIVLVIIGLVVGGIVVGQSVILSAQVRGTVSTMDKYKAAYNTFQSKYSCVPGDCANASSFGLTGGFYNDGLVNGDGDGLIYSYDDGNALPSNCGSGPGSCALYGEAWTAFAHLYSAQLIPTLPIVNNNATQNNVPAITNAFLFFTSLMPKSPPAWYTTPPLGNYLYLGGILGQLGNEQDFYLSYSVLTPALAQMIDLKIDDGLPMAGNVRASWVSYACGFSGDTNIGGPCYNHPTLRSQQSTACVDDTVTPPIYWVNGWKGPSSGNLGNCSLHEPAD